MFRLANSTELLKPGDAEQNRCIPIASGRQVLADRGSHSLTYLQPGDDFVRFSFGFPLLLQPVERLLESRLESPRFCRTVRDTMHVHGFNI